MKCKQKVGLCGPLKPPLGNHGGTGTAGGARFVMLPSCFLGHFLAMRPPRGHKPPPQGGAQGRVQSDVEAPYFGPNISLEGVGLCKGGYGMSHIYIYILYIYII